MQDADRTNTLDRYVRQLHEVAGLQRKVPNFDPNNGNERARCLLILEAPGPQAIKSGYVSLDNPDRTASNLREQLRLAGVDRSSIALWNLVPWYIGNEAESQIRPPTPAEVEQGTTHLLSLLPLLTDLRCIVLVGAAARRAPAGAPARRRPFERSRISSFDSSVQSHHRSVVHRSFGRRNTFGCTTAESPRRSGPAGASVGGGSTEAPV